MPSLSNTRRGFLSQTAATLAASQSRILGANDRVNTALIGAGNLGLRHIRDRLLPLHNEKAIQIVAVCDIYEKAKQRAQERTKLARKDIHHDYREMIARRDVDAVVIVTPEHLHHRMTMDSLQAGKDVYLEKPMSYSIPEAKEMAETVKKTGRVLQVGSQYLSDPRYHLAKEVIEKGWIGQIAGAQTAWGMNSMYGLWQYDIEPEANEKTIDWKAFLGPAPQRPFSAERYFRWRKYWDYSGGIGPDLFYHQLSPLLFAMGPRFPVRVSGHGGIRVFKDREVPDVFSMTTEYEDFSIELSGLSYSSAIGRHHQTAIFGREATISFVKDAIEVKPEPLFKTKFQSATGKPELRLSREPNDYEAIRMVHFRNFLESMRSRRQPVFDATFGYQVMTAIKLGCDSYRESRMMAFDPRSERVVERAPRRPGYEGTGENYQEPGASLPDGRKS